MRGVRGSWIKRMAYREDVAATGTSEYHLTLEQRWCQDVDTARKLEHHTFLLQVIFEPCEAKKMP
jgi:hypothetical protein